MCIICVSRVGYRQPTKAELSAMFDANPHGAGYMFARDGKVEIHKGFMVFDDFWRSVRSERFTKNDAVVYHFRISTQAGVNPSMTHPFPLTKNSDLLKALDVVCDVGIAHNGIIRLTSNGSKEFSDTALFIRDFLTRLVVKISDIHDDSVLNCVEMLINSKMALLDGSGEIAIIGKFINEGGLLFSNNSYKITREFVKSKDLKFWNSFCFDY